MELDRLDDQELNKLIYSLERRVRSALALGESDIVHCLLDEYLAADEELDRRFTVWQAGSKRVVLAMN
jgi:hypothetical protein